MLLPYETYSLTRFSGSSFFINRTQTDQQTDQQAQIFSILVKNSLSYSNFKFDNQTSRGIRPYRVKKHRYLPRHDSWGLWYPSKSVSLGSHIPASQSPQGLIPWRVNLSGVLDPGELITPGSDTLASQSPWSSQTLASQSPQGLIHWWVNLPGVWDPGESISLGPETLESRAFWGQIPQSKLFRIWITRQNCNQNRKYFHPLLVSGSGRFERWKNLEVKCGNLFPNFFFWELYFRIMLQLCIV